jgi:alkylation response protein AidB-like acyl-CoA dehydrogenase
MPFVHTEHRATDRAEAVEHDRLASIQTKGVDDGSHFIVNGSKIWTSFADKCDWIFALVRTEPPMPKHRGISFLLIDMDDPGVTTRPIRLISGDSHFCQTFFDNVAEQIGRVLAASPILSTLIAMEILRRDGSADQKALIDRRAVRR